MYERENALTVLVRMKIEQHDSERVGQMFPFAQMQEWREMREKQGRILTAKDIRAKLNIGLSEAMVICKGIETHYGIQ